MLINEPPSHQKLLRSTNRKEQNADDEIEDKLTNYCRKLCGFATVITVSENVLIQLKHYVKIYTEVVQLFVGKDVTGQYWYQNVIVCVTTHGTSTSI